MVLKRRPPTAKRRTERRFMSTQRQMAYERDRERCVLCNSQPATVHEIKYRSKRRPYDPETFKLSNLVTLCANCHEKWHTDKKFRLDALERLKYLLPEEERDGRDRGVSVHPRRRGGNLWGISNVSRRLRVQQKRRNVRKRRPKRHSPFDS